ncbi:hypothetical protein NLG97_g6671 [Lecanicillium saksenae]|uniref:Uncharacterized protein n=1 Tax=Lecanicillium saksenae TaxID=468837 RepID=A0ACC1QST3_9HYPO|nr:hypothetical protein NLG97_g6671 [Lecanicillium saksenae]
MKPAVLVSWALVGLTSSSPLPVDNEIRADKDCSYYISALRQATLIYNGLVAAHAAADAVDAAKVLVELAKKGRDVACII